MGLGDWGSVLKIGSRFISATTLSLLVAGLTASCTPPTLNSVSLKNQNIAGSESSGQSSGGGSGSNGGSGSGNSGSGSGGGPPYQANFLSDQGLKSARSLIDYDYTASTGTYQAERIHTEGQPNFSWDGLLRFTSGYANRVGGGYWYGVNVWIVDYVQTQKDAQGQVAFFFKTGDSNYPAGFPVYQALQRGLSGQCTGEFLYVIPPVCSGSTWRVALDGSQYSSSSSNPFDGSEPNVLNPTTRFGYAWHQQVIPHPQRPQKENPYLSDSNGNPATGNTNYMTWDILLLMSIVSDPQPGDADYSSATSGKDRDRIGFVSGKITAQFSVSEGNHRIPTRIIQANLDKATFGIIRLSGTTPTSMRIARGIEPTMERTGNLLFYNTNMYYQNFSPQSTSPGTDHLAFVRRIQGRWDDPYCALGTTNCVPLLFSDPLNLSSLSTIKTTAVPGTTFNYGQLYPITRYPLAAPMGEHVYASGEKVGGAYPWLSLDGDFYTATTSRGVGRYLDPDGPAATF